MARAGSAAKKDAYHRKHRGNKTAFLPIVGKRAVEELLRRDILPEVLLVSATGRRSKDLVMRERYRCAGWKIEVRDRVELDRVAEGLHHQGYVALLRDFPYQSLAELMQVATDAASDPIFVALDQVQDAGNLGAILRSAECAGVQGVIIPDRRAAAISAAVIRCSAGAALHLPICRIGNIGRALDILKQAGFRILGADQEGERSIFTTDLAGPVVIIIGSEGRGLRPGVKRRCDALLSIPIRGRTASLNASVAAALCIYEAVRQRIRTQ